MELQVFVNGTMVADWKDTFPNYMTSANSHNWKPYPNFATITLAAGLQLIKFQAPFKHLNLDYVQFALVGADGGTVAIADGGATGTGGTGGAAGTTGAAGTSGTSGAGGTTGAGGEN